MPAAPEVGGAAVVPIRRWTKLSAAIVVVSCLAAACSSGAPHDSTSATRSTALGPSGPAFAPCWGRAGGAAASTAAASAAVEAFGVGGSVQAAIEQDVGLKAAAIRPEAHLVRRDGDAATTLSSVASLQRHLLDAPKWAHATVSGIAGIASQECARSGGEVLAGVVSDLAAQNRTEGEPGPARQPIEDLTAGLGGEGALASAFQDVFAVRTAWSRHPESGSYAQSEQAIGVLEAALDPTTRLRLAAVVRAMAYAERSRLAAVHAWYPSGPDVAELERIFSSREVPAPRARSFDYAAVGRAGAALALVVERLEVHLAAHPLPVALDTTIATPLGEVVLDGGHRDDDRTLSAPALVVDQAGNDTYHGVIAGPAMPAIPLSVLIDLAGNDSYLAGEATATQGAGVLSFGYLLDRAGNDRYEATTMAQGAGFLGVGAIYDGGGDDAYQAREMAQGAARFGLGAAVDLSGKDTWRLTSLGQGFGFVRGVGVLVDAGGDDVYDANDTVITNPSAQTPDHNASLAQGAGFGQRTGSLRNRMGGGIGLLIDLAGRDRYSCGVFCQGTGYYFGHGVLYDAGGDDTYHGAWYVQGSAAHFALATLMDESGNDAYETVRSCSRGAGHDESAGFFFDGGGDDHYTVSRLSNGATSNAGFGFFVDAAGADTYASVGADVEGRYGQTTIDGDFPGFRGYGSARAVAMFLDLGGDDRYQGSPPPVRNSAHWAIAGYVGPALGAAHMPAEQVGLGRDLG